MAEPTVQVPVSLIERIRAGLPLWKYEVDPEADALMAALDALLSQPTPTTEPDDVELCDCGEPAAVCAAKRAMPAAPPPIADMVPGTTFTAEGVGVPDTSHRFHVMERTGTRWLTCLTHGTGARPDYVDPSTIRDVTPPAVTT